MSRTRFFIWTIFLAIYGCSDNDLSKDISINAPIHWNVNMEESAITRTLMTDNSDLQRACNPNEGGKSIAIWGSNNSPEGYVFKGTLLTYESKETTVPHIWNYVNEYDVYWLYGYEYNFLAYYPSDLLGVAATSSTLNVEGYDTKLSQEDLLVAHTFVNTADAAFDKYAPVPLQMNHALAAVKFKVKSEDGRTMTLKSLSLSGLYTKGDFVYQSKSTPAVTDWKNHSDNTASYDWTGTLTFGGTAADVTGYTGASPLTQYAEDGFILVIPQQNCTPALDIATTDKVYDRAVLGKVDFEPGKQYVYTITVTPADALKVTLRIKPWNELNSSYDITF